jgi:hypothetical protein
LTVRGGFHFVRDHLLQTWNAKINRQRIEPVIRPVNPCERLDALPATGDEIMIVIGIHPESQPPLAQVINAGARARFLVRPGQRGQKQPGKRADYSDDYEEFNQRERPRPPGAIRTRPAFPRSASLRQTHHRYI